jgi:hypothetical protein
MKKQSGVKFSSLGWILLGAIVLGGLLYISFIIVLSSLRPSNPSQYQFSTAVITLIPAPTLTPVILSPTTNPPNSTSTSQVPVPAGGIAIGIYVKISGTNGTGLNLRTGPGTASPIRFLGMDDEVFEVKDGPKQVDNLIWWFLQAPYDSTRNGWAAANYLTVIQTP